MRYGFILVGTAIFALSGCSAAEKDAATLCTNDGAIVEKYLGGSTVGNDLAALCGDVGVTVPTVATAAPTPAPAPAATAPKASP